MQRRQAARRKHHDHLGLGDEQDALRLSAGQTGNPDSRWFMRQVDNRRDYGFGVIAREYVKAQHTRPSRRTLVRQPATTHRDRELTATGLRDAPRTEEGLQHDVSASKDRNGLRAGGLREHTQPIVEREDPDHGHPHMPQRACDAAALPEPRSALGPASIERKRRRSAQLPRTRVRPAQ